MKKLITLPHRVCESTCFWNGLEDMFAWKGVNYPDFLLSSVGGMPGFAFINSKRANPPHQVYWGACPKYLIRDLAQITGFSETVIEGKAFKSMLTKLKRFIDDGLPVMAGALDMYYLHYFPYLYKKIHVPIHYVLVVGYDDEEKTVFVHDCCCKQAQRISYEEFEKSLDVSTPGMSKKNTFRAFALPEKIPSEFEVAAKGFRFKAEKQLKPPVNLFGIPAMQKATEQIPEWNDKKCFEQMVAYATTPPMLPITYENSDGMRFRQATVLKALGNKYKVECWNEASALFQKSGAVIIELCRAAMQQNGKQVSARLLEVAEIEEEAYRLLLKPI
ncbi:MAG: BtrH N-terminal domain-containing protein [Candidatus Bathyarchaeota archaeon]|nr:BtrH N-terminal domain-containing protein [Candidatus Bathyarchaeota archaeon]